MKIAIVFLVAVTGAAPAVAQVAEAPRVPGQFSYGDSVMAFSEAAKNYGFGSDKITLEMRRYKIARALALKDEAARLQIIDGGTLSPRSIAYINRKAAAIRRLRG